MKLEFPSKRIFYYFADLLNPCAYLPDQAPQGRNRNRKWRKGQVFFLDLHGKLFSFCIGSVFALERQNVLHRRD